MRIEIPFFTLIDKILPLLSTLLGAFITYYVTVLSKKNEIKVNAQTKARDEYWIPCSMAISNLQKKIAALTKDENCYVSFQGENSCELQTAELLKYLQADKRVFFYERTRNILSLLEKNIQNFENAVDNDVQSLIKDFRKHYYSMLHNFSVYINNNCTDCAITIKKTLPQEIKTALLTHNGIVWHGQVVNVDFIRGDYDLSNTFSTDMSYSSDDFYFDVWYQIKEGCKQREEFGLAPEQQLGLDVLDFEYENIGKFANILNQAIKTKDYQAEYTKIFETLSLLQSEILNNIDKATIL